MYWICRKIIFNLPKVKNMLKLWHFKHKLGGKKEFVCNLIVILFKIHFVTKKIYFKLVSNFSVEWLFSGWICHDVCTIQTVMWKKVIYFWQDKLELNLNIIYFSFEVRCRYCRYQKCLLLGMDQKSVEVRRIWKYITKMKNTFSNKN
jgi:hypothetical protein